MTSRIRAAIALTCALAALSVAAASAGATPPANDNWAGATDLGSAGTVDVDTSNAGATADFNPDTFEATGPSIGGQYRSSSVWFKWTAPRSGDIRVDTCGGDPNGYDGYMAIFTQDGDVPPFYNLLQRNGDDDSCGGDHQRLPSFDYAATAGRQYWIAFSAFTTNADSGTNFKLRISTQPANASVPALDGNPALRLVGDEINAAPGDWDGTAPLNYTYQWFSCDSSGDDCTEIAGATDSSYTPVADDAGHALRVRVTGSNDVGSADAQSGPTVPIDTDDDGDGVGDSADNCVLPQDGDVKANGCVPEGIEISQPSHIEGDATPGSATGLTLVGGTAGNTPGDDDSVQYPEVDAVNWYRCSDPSETSTCESRSGYPSPSQYVVGEDDLGGYIRARITWLNSDTQIYEWVDPITLYKISIFNRPSITGTPQVGQTLTGADGLGQNVPATESGDSDPSVAGRTWLYCTSPTDESTCTASGQTGSTLSPPANAVGKYVVFGVTWDNGFTARHADSDVAGPIVAAPVIADPPAPYAPLNLAALALPKKASVKGISKAKGKFSIKTIQFACPAGGASCAISLSFAAKVKGKTKKLGTSTQSVPAGETQPLAGKLSSAGLKLFKKNKKLKITISMNGAGGAAGKATFKEFTITK